MQQTITRSLKSIEPSPSTSFFSSLYPPSMVAEHTLFLEDNEPTESELHSTPKVSSSMSFRERFEILRDRVLTKRPVLSRIIKKRGDKPLLDYAREYTHVNLNPPIQQRQNEFLVTFGEEVERLLGPDIRAKAVEQLSKHYFVSTADHMGPLCHPFFLNSNLVTAAPYFDPLDPEFQYIIVLSCSIISFDNSSFPRGFQFHSMGAADKKSELYSCGIFGRNVRPSPVFRFRSYTLDDIAQAEKKLNTSVKDGEILPRERDLMVSLFNDIYRKPDVLNCSYFSEQMIKTNFSLWRRFFSTSHATPPDIIYVEQESLVSKLLMKYHLDQDTIIQHIIFDPAYDEMVNRYFEGIQGSFSRAEGWGTYLFWAFPKGSKYRIQLWKKNGALVSADGSYRLELTPDNVRRALEAKEIFTSTLMDFIVLSFYYGLKCLGGFNQVNYLTAMKNAYIKMNVDLGNYRSIEVCARAQTKELCDGLSVAFLGCNGELALATGVDLLLYGDQNTWSRIFETCKNISFEESINPLMPEMYRVSYEETEWEEPLISITERDINTFTGLDQKLQPCVTVH